MRGNNWTEEELALLKSLWGKVHGVDIYPQIPRHPIRTIQCKASLLKLKADRSQCNEMYTRNEKFFSVPNLLNSYYAGWIAADGCITRKGARTTVCLSLQARDVEVIRNLMRDANYNGAIYDRPGRTSYHRGKAIVGGPSKGIHVSSKEWAMDLEMNWNITPRKSLAYIGPKSYGFDNDLSFILGALEGDGTICVYYPYKSIPSPYLSLCGTPMFLNWVKDFFDRNYSCFREFATVRQKSDGGPTYEYQINGERTLRILKDMWNLPVPHLSRKWNHPELQTMLGPKSLPEGLEQPAIATTEPPAALPDPLPLPCSA